MDFRTLKPPSKAPVISAPSIRRALLVCLALVPAAASAWNPGWLKRPVSTCTDGAVSKACTCGGVKTTSGFCCLGVAQASDCLTINYPFSSQGVADFAANESGVSFIRGGNALLGASTATRDQTRVGASGLWLEREQAVVLLTAVASGSGGTLGTATDYYRVTSLGAWGESAAGPEKFVAVTGPTGSATLTWPAIPNATGYRIYGRATGAQTAYWEVGAVTTWTDTGTAGTAGTPPVTGGAVAEILTVPSWRAFGPTGHRFSGSVTLSPEWTQDGGALVRTLWYAPGTGSQVAYLYYAYGPRIWNLVVTGSGATGTTTSAAQTFAAGSSINLAWTIVDGSAPSLTVNGVETHNGANPGNFSPLDVVMFGTQALVNYGGGNLATVTDSGVWGSDIDASISNFVIDLQTGTTIASKPAPDVTKIVALGDSTTLGAACTLSPTYPAALGTALGGGFVVTNGGVGGEAVFGVRTRWRSTYRTAQGIVVLLVGTNDIAAGSTANQAYDVWRLLADEILASGAKLMVVTPFPRTGLSAAGKTALASYSASLVAYATARGLPYVDLFTNPTFNDGANNFIAGMTCDGTHPTQAAATGAGGEEPLIYAAGQAAKWW